MGLAGKGSTGSSPGLRRYGLIGGTLACRSMLLATGNIAPQTEPYTIPCMYYKLHQKPITKVVSTL